MNKLCPLGPAGVGRIVNLFFGPACFPSCNYTKGALSEEKNNPRSKAKSQQNQGFQQKLLGLFFVLYNVGTAVS